VRERGALVHLFFVFCSRSANSARIARLCTAGAGACRSLDDGALFLTLAANMVGCFFAGLLGTPASVGVPPDTRNSDAALACVPAAHRVQRCGAACAQRALGVCCVWRTERYYAPTVCAAG
jgi:hypothetical protein